MGMSINTNVSALNTYRNLNATQNSLTKSLEKLSSGLRINRAADDAAGLTIATGIGSQVSGLQVASRNAQDGVSVVQTADGALGQAQNILGRLRDLAVQAANDSNSTEARTAIGNEANSLVSELDRLGKSVSFNGKNLLDGSATTLQFQVGANGDAQSQITVALGGGDLTAVAKALSNGSTGVATTAAQTSTIATLRATNTNGSVTNFTVPSSLTTALTGKTVDEQVALLNGNGGFASTFVATKNGANLNITAKDGSTVTAFDNASTPAAVGTAAAASGSIGFGSASAAQAAIASIDTQIGNVSTARAGFGALQNRFENAIASISVSIENLSASKSRITDVDMASEMVNFTRAQVLSQSGTAMLAQANSLPQMALKLLG